MLAFYNGNAKTKQIHKDALADSYCLLYGTENLYLSDGLLSAEIPPHSLLVLSENDGTRRGFLKDGICYLTPQKESTIQCEGDAVAAQYKFYGGKPELVGIYASGETLLDGEGEIRFFCWDKMQPRKHPAY